MESAWTAARNIFRKRCARCAKTLKRWSLKQMRNLLWRADEWVLRQEVRLRDEAATADFQSVVDPVKSATRERARREGAAAVSLRAGEHKPILSAPSRRPRLPRLKYQGGQFVRTA
jgi:hypothetical protein